MNKLREARLCQRCEELLKVSNDVRFHAGRVVCRTCLVELKKIDLIIQAQREEQRRTLKAAEREKRRKEALRKCAKKIVGTIPNVQT